MKTRLGRHTHSRHEQKPKDERTDAYRARGKLAEPARCAGCGAVWRDGRWQWETVRAGAGLGARKVLCPACHRMKDGLPAGYIALDGEFFAAHRAEVLSSVRAWERSEKKEHPLQRIMAVETRRDACVITTTDSHLARRIGAGLKAAFKGRLVSRYHAQDNLLRVTWTR